MKVLEIPIEKLRGAPWNCNRMSVVMQEKLKASIVKYGMVQNLVVRPSGEDSFEVLSGNQRLEVLKPLGLHTAPCFVVELDDARARLLAQALNRLHGEDELGLRAELVRAVLQAVSKEEVMAVLPETRQSLETLASLGQESLAAHLARWEETRGARLKHLIFQLTHAQLEVVEQALERLVPEAKEARGASPNTRGTALYLLCRRYLETDL